MELIKWPAPQHRVWVCGCVQGGRRYSGQEGGKNRVGAGRPVSHRLGLLQAVREADHHLPDQGPQVTKQQSWARNSTMPRQRDHVFWPVVDNCIISIFVVATPFRHRDLNILRFFLVPFDYVVAKLQAYNIVACPALQNSTKHCFLSFFCLGVVWQLILWAFFCSLVLFWSFCNILQWTQLPLSTGNLSALSFLPDLDSRTNTVLADPRKSYNTAFLALELFSLIPVL